MFKLIISIINRPPLHQMRFSSSVSDNITWGRFHEAARNSPKYVPPIGICKRFAGIDSAGVLKQGDSGSCKAPGVQPKDMSQL